ncbi:recombinase family protein [Luteibacter rhizovicinus]|uniref:recombinase family protein n=1 Tax=Luteibacter rhizovicinus TaxID=242606 RepID=UPI003D18EAF4
MKELVGERTYGAYAAWLNEHGYRTRRGHHWTGRAVSRVFKRLTDAAQNPTRRT